MAHFAQLNSDNEVVNVIVIDNDNLMIDGEESEQVGINFCNSLIPGFDWKQTSYNTFGGRHAYDGVPFRKNYAGVGFTYDSTRDAFIPPQPYPSWKLVESTCLWEPPVEYRNDGKTYSWDEEHLTWVEVTTVAILP